MSLSLIATAPAPADYLAVLTRFARGFDELCYRRSVGGCGRHQLIRVSVLAGNLVSNGPQDFVALHIQHFG